MEEARRAGVGDLELLKDDPGISVFDLEAAWQYVETHREEIEQAIRLNRETQGAHSGIIVCIRRLNRPHSFSPTDTMPLRMTPRQTTFADFWLAGVVAGAAYEKAGYKARGAAARVEASKL